MKLLLQNLALTLSGTIVTLKKLRILDFPVLTREKTIVHAHELSDVLANLPPLRIDYVFIAPEILSMARQWLEGSKDAILSQPIPSEDLSS